MADIKIYGTLKNVTNEPIANAEQIGNLATVATSGSYNDLDDKPTIQELATVKQLYALDATNPDYPSRIGKYSHFDITSVFGTISIVTHNSDGTEHGLSDIRAQDFEEAQYTIDNTTYTSYYKDSKYYYLGIKVPFFIANVEQYGNDYTFGVIKFTSTQNGVFKVHSSEAIVPSNCTITVNGVVTQSLMPYTIAVQVNKGDVVKVTTLRTDNLYGRIIGFVLEGNCGVSVFTNDAGYITATDVADKQDKMPIVQVASGITAINAAVNTYYEVAGEVGALAITLPTPTDTSKIAMVVIHLTAGTNPNVVIGAVDNPQPDFSAAYDISASKEYEINCMYNGDKWVVADMEVL